MFHSSPGFAFFSKWAPNSILNVIILQRMDLMPVTAGIIVFESDPLFAFFTQTYGYLKGPCYRREKIPHSTALPG